MAKNVRKLTGDQLLQEISEVLAGSDGDTVLEVANSIFADHPFRYVGENSKGQWMFEQDVKED